MILFEITGREDDQTYQALEISNGNRQYDFLLSIVAASLSIERPFLSTQILKALNYHAITCLHTNPGEFRPCAVHVGAYEPPAHFRVPALMDDFVNYVNRNWENADPVVLAAFVLWRLNHIHPFINGNGRTARAACYFVLCVKAGRLLPGTKILPELLRENRPAYVDALKAVDQSLNDGALDLAPLHGLLSALIAQQIDGHLDSDQTEDPDGSNAPIPDEDVN